MKIELNYKKNILFLVAIILPTLLYVTGCSDKKNANAPILFGQYDNAKDNNMYLEIRTIDTDGESNTYYIYDDSLIEEFVNDVRNIDLQVNKSPEHITGKNDNDAGACVELNDVKRAFHGYDSVIKSSITIKNVKKRIAFMRKCFM